MKEMLSARGTRRERTSRKKQCFLYKGLLDFKVGNITELLREKSHD